MNLRFFKPLALLVLAALLGGCASVRLLDTQVLALAQVPPGVQLQGARYRFERLPSQAGNPEAGLAEQQAEQALAAVGLVRDDAAAQLSVLVGGPLALNQPEALDSLGVDLLGGDARRTVELLKHIVTARRS